jgi:hypothetical protein
MKRIYHHYELWEDWQHGMYALGLTRGDDRAMPAVIEASRQLLINLPALRDAMQFVAFNWTHAAEVNLTNPNRNYQAWLGQAACCHHHGAPECLTKLAWHQLSTVQQDAANAIADGIMEAWLHTRRFKGQTPMFEGLENYA